jgi:NAD(P)-dependent dehydrogenase (short-subunit alcohol dehydrogenase family)
MPVSVITGGASGLGRALGERCAKRGHDVVLLDLDGDRAAHEAAALSAAHGIKALGMLTDVSDARSVDAAAYAVEQRFGAADLVVSNVGVQLFGPVERFTDDEWRWVLDVNVVGSARVARAFIPLLRKAGQRGKHLAFTTSSSVFDPASRLGAYQASKFAVWGLAETLRLELHADGIDVSVIFPSGMASRHLETSQSAQPDHLRRPVGEPADFEAMMASNPQMATADMIRTPEDAADGVIDAVLAGERYVVTHGDFVEALNARHSALIHAVESRRA